MGEKRKITLHQTLHGYQEGHRLLATSTELNAGEKTMLSQLSDASGTGKESGFTTYLTGYPLPNSRYYAFARTWYAEEMPRPGCVWTHTLLIDIALIWMFKEPEQLLQLFIRPQGGDHVNYNKPLIIEAQDGDSEIRHDPELDKLTCLLYSSDKNLVLLAGSAVQYEALILKVWNLQWPRLKRAFRFCTGSLSIRKAGTEVFDLQVVPYAREKSLNRSDRASVEILDMTTAVCQSDWLPVYQESDPAAMLEFMTQYGADLKPAKTRFAGMVKAWSAEKQVIGDASELFKFWDKNFTDAEEGRQLKIALFDRAFRSVAKDRYALLYGVLTDTNWNMIDWDVQGLIGFAWESGSLNQGQFLRLLNVLVKRSFNPSELLLNIPAKVWIDELVLYQVFLPELVSRLDKRAYAAVWTAAEEIQDAWWPYLRPLMKDSAAPIVTGMLDHGNGRFSQDLLELMGDKIFQYLFNWMDMTEQNPVSEWQYLIVLNPAGAFKQLSAYKQPRMAVLSLFLDNVSPTNADWRKVPHEHFVRFFERYNQVEPSFLKTAIYTYFLTTCLTGNVAQPDLLVQLIFQPLHDGLEADICDRDSWQRFKMELGRDLYVMLELDFFSKHFKDRQEVPDWDRCEFLRRSLLSSFLKFQWNIAMLLDVVQREDTFEKIIEFGVDVKPLKKLFKSLKKALEHGPLSRSFYYKVLKQSL